MKLLNLFIITYPQPVTRCFSHWLPLTASQINKIDLTRYGVNMSFAIQEFSLKYEQNINYSVILIQLLSTWNGQHFQLKQPLMMKRNHLLLNPLHKLHIRIGQGLWIHNFYAANNSRFTECIKASVYKYL